MIIEKNIEKITSENKALLIDNERMRHIIEDINIIHYDHPKNIQDAMTLNNRLYRENSFLKEKLEDIYDI
jgi:hypothetical protein